MNVETLPAPDLDTSTATELTPELAEILEQYLLGLERGERPDAELLIRQHPQWGEPLRAYLASIDLMHASLHFGKSPQADGPALGAPAARQLGDYQIIREIGRGGMGVVYEALQLSLVRRVALKVLPQAIGWDPRQINRFWNEAQAAAQLQHPHIVPVYWVGCEEGVHCYAMQYVEGRSLEHLIREVSRSSQTNQGSGHWRLVARLGLEAAEALEHAHQSGVIHRDIKPSNLLIDAAGKLWITDFGLARFKAEGSLTISGEVVGTLRYMSPEQLRGQPGLVDQRTDLYSLGITLYELLTLRPAFSSQEQPELMREVEAAEPPAPRRINRDIPRDLETVLLKCIAKQRDDRYSTAAELAEELRRFLAGKSPLARRPTAVERSYRWAQRHIRLVTAAAALALIALVATSAAAIMIGQQKQHTEQALIEARENFNRAERNFQQARQIVDRFWTRAAGQLADLPGAESLRRELLGEAREYYRGFIQQARHNALLQADLAAACFRVGEISEQLGADAEALSAYEEARRHWRQVADRRAAAAQEADLALCENNLGLLRGRQGELKLAEELLRSAITRQEKLTAAQPQNRRFRSQLATSFNNLGLQLGQAGRREDAESAYEEAILLHESLLRESDEPQVRSDLAAAYNNLGYLRSQTDPAAARQAYQQAIQRQSQLAEQFPAAPRLRSDLAQTYNNVGAIVHRLKDYDAAARSYEQALQLQEQLVQASPLMPAYRRELAVTFNNLGFLHSDGKRFEAALAAFDQARQFFARLAEEHPQALEHHSSLGGVHNNLGMAYEGLERTQEALAAYELAVQQQRIAFEAAPQVDRYREFLSTHYVNLGRTQRAAGQFPEAEATALARKALWPGNPQRLFPIACELALAAGRDDDLRQSCLAHAFTTLQEAAAAGFADPAALQNSTDLDCLRRHPAFSERMEELQRQFPALETRQTQP